MYQPMTQMYQPSMQQYQGYQPMCNQPAYQPQIPAQMQIQASQQVPAINGRMVGSYEEIKPEYVPMNGNVHWFPLNDGSCVYGKFWDNQGMLKAVKYVPENVEQVKVEDPVVMLNNKLDQILDMLNKNDEVDLDDCK